MMHAALLLLLSSTAASNNGDVNVEDAFRQYCQDWCLIPGNVLNCDIGSGNLVGTGSLAAGNFNSSEDGRSSPHPGAPARDEDRDTSAGMNCNEAIGNTCVTYGGQDAWCNYPQYKCMSHYASGLSEGTYTNIRTTAEDRAAGFVFTHYTDNLTPLEATTTVTFHRETSASASLSLTSTVEFGIEMKQEVKVPLIMDMSFKESMKISTSHTSAQSITSSNSWSIQQPVVVPPNSTRKVQLVVQKVAVSADWTGRITFPKYAKLWCTFPVLSHHEWFVPAQQFLPQAYPDQCSENTCDITARFTGWQGMDSWVEIYTCPLFQHDKCKHEETLIV